jgi:hypothetical protein
MRRKTDKLLWALLGFGLGLNLLMTWTCARVANKIAPYFLKAEAAAACEDMGFSREGGALKNMTGGR